MTDPTGNCLAGLRVVEIGDGVAGSVAASTFAVLGATVAKVIAVDRPLSAHPPFLSGPTGARVSALAAVLDDGKKLVDSSLVDAAVIEALVADADIVIDDRVDGAPGRAHVKGSTRVLVTITPFGLDGPNADRPGGELLLQAAGGLLATVVSVHSDAPTPAPAFVALRSTGHVAALAALHGLDRFRTTQQPVRLDVSAQESVAFTSALPECAHVLYRCPGRSGSGRYLAPSGIFTCRDGSVRIAAIEDHQWRGMVRCLGEPSWTEGLESRPARVEHAELITQRVEAWTRTQDKAACAQVLQDAGVPATPVNGPDELLESSQFAHRGVFRDGELAGISVRKPGPPWRATSGRGRRDVSGALSDLRVVEITHVLAGPIVGSLLGAMGAQVVRLEDLDRLDIYRRTGPFADGVPGAERGAYFAVANHSKDSVAVDGDLVGATAGRLLADADLLVENVGSARLRRLGIDLDQLADQPGILTTRVSGFGSDGPMAGYRVYANNVQAYGGLAAATVDCHGEPARLGTVLADPLSSVIGATASAAWALGSLRGTGGCIDLSMAEVVMGSIIERVVAASVPDPAPDLDQGRTGQALVHVCRDGRWIAVDATPENSYGVDLAALAAAHDRDGALGDLAARGIPAAAVMTGADLTEDPHLAQRGFFPTVRHDDPEVGHIRLVGLPWRFAGEGPIALRPPPRLAGANIRFGLDEGAFP